MLMTKFTYSVSPTETGSEIVVTRLEDNAVKKFHITGNFNDDNRLGNFMDSITDDLAEGYFPKEHKKTKKK